jgi:hypothetical protein
MGAWGTGIFDNDDAADWGYGLPDRGLDLIEEALAVVDVRQLELDQAAVALAAAETVARLRGAGSVPSAYTEDVDAWVAEQQEPPSEELVERARAAVERVGGEDCELAELWDETDEAQQWRTVLEDLQRRLG